MKKTLCIAVLAVVGMSCFAQESLSEFLDAINDVNNQKIELSSSLNHEYDTELYRIQKATQEELASISKLEKERYEDDDDFSKRINELIAETTKKNDEALRQLKNKAEIDSKGKLIDLETKKKELISKMEQKEYVYYGDSVSVSFGEFKTKQKLWPVTVKSLEDQLNYTGTFEYQLDKDYSIKEQFEKIDALLADNLITAEIHFRVINRGLNSNLYEKYVQKVILYGPNNDTIKEYDVNQVVDTFNLYQTVYEDSTVYKY